MLRLPGSLRLDAGRPLFSALSLNGKERKHMEKVDIE